MRQNVLETLHSVHYTSDIEPFDFQPIYPENSADKSSLSFVLPSAWTLAAPSSGLEVLDKLYHGKKCSCEDCKYKDKNKFKNAIDSHF